LELDIMGQICSESIGSWQFSGTDGQVDFVEGADRSKNEKTFLCLPAPYQGKNGTLRSRIKQELTSSAIITTPRTAGQ
jgi:acyl-CoA hydrolase